ncbi:MAG: alpha/beta fold hydrolase, partial [Acidimicrobiia bacterium]|nr:alpha/beta fold hydrolase [Acidimicrobiia bacterium]
MTVSIRRRFSAATAFALLLTLVFTGSADAAPKADNRPELKWSKCYQDVTAETGTAYECTQVNVPLDHDSPRGATISLALVRIPASDTEDRIGSLFLNPGGPGGSGVDFALFFGPFAPFVWGPIADQYDIVGFDPRGIIRSTPLRCFGNINQAVQAFPPLPFPSIEDELPLFERGDNLLNDKCIQRGNKVLEHMSTANVARDLDLLRQAVGDDVLNFVGLSYGTMLGQTYANLFPDRVGAVVIDGVLDPIAWANVGSDVPFSTALRSDVGALDTLEEFFRQCDAAMSGNCDFAPNAADRFDALLDRLRNAPILFTDPDTGETFPYLYSFLIGDVLGALYDPGAFPRLAEFLAVLEVSPDATSLGFA